MIYFPMTVNILTPGHIKCLEELTNKDSVVVGLLTAKALEGYKKEIVPFKDRLFILENLSIVSHGSVLITPQNSLNPIKNIKKYNCWAIASGDGWEDEELKAINKAGITAINIKLPKEKTKKYSSSKILKI